jgi:macrolide transport system ATP-binding/permease protein
MRSLIRKLSWLSRPSRKEAELQEELQFHLEEEAEERKAAGLSQHEARYAARRDLGNVALVAEDTRAAWTWAPLEHLLQDTRYGFRTMAANRTFSALAILSLALGIGANTAIFSFMDSLLLRKLPVSDPRSLVMMQWHARKIGRYSVFHSWHGRADGDDKTGTNGGIFPIPAFELFAHESTLFSSVFGRFNPGDLHLAIQGQGEVAHGEYVTGEYFRGLGVQTSAGRPILPEDDRPGAPPIAVLSFGLAQRRFGSPANAIGRTIEINNVPFTVAGVAPPAFFGVDPGAASDLYLPLHASQLLPDPRPAADWFHDSNSYWFYILARLRPGVTAAQAQAVLAEPYHRWVSATAASDRERAELPVLRVTSGASGLDAQRHDYSRPLWILTALVALILAMACANIANLLLARSGGRSREMAIRLSIGAGRLRVVRQLLTESVLLALVGGAVGIGVALWGVRFLNLLLAAHAGGTDLHADVNWQVLAAAAGLSLLAGVVFGLAPALRSTRVDLMPALKESRTGESRSHSRLRPSLSQVLMVFQVAITLVMLVAAGLFTRTLANLHSITLGFHPENVLTFRLNARQAGHRDPEIATFYGDLRRQFAALPGVRGVSMTNIPLIGDNWIDGVALPGQEPKTTNLMSVGADFFSTIELPILRGRGIEERDRPGSPLVAVVNERFVQERCGGRDPVGQHLVLDRDGIFNLEIVGVSGNARYYDLKQDLSPIVYLSFSQKVLPVDDMTYVLRTSGNPLGHASAVRELVRRADPRLPLSDVRTESQQIDRTVNQEIAFAQLCTAFAVLALAIACVGLYGTVSYNVARRTGEIGIRMALGAQRGIVVRMVLREVITVAAVGLAISVPGALAASKLVRSFLFGLEPNDPAALMSAVAILAAAAMLAGYVPARRASRIEPMAALRHE